MPWLPPLGDQEDTRDSPLSLPPLAAPFFVKPLPDKPQNPLMDRMEMYCSKHSGRRAERGITDSVAPNEPHVVQADPQHASESTLWDDALRLEHTRTPSLLSWDTLRFSHSPKSLGTPFLSEGTSEDFAIARHFVQPPLFKDLKSDVTYVTEGELLQSLRATVLGTSSRLYQWDGLSELFQPMFAHGKSSLLLVYGKDEKISASIVRRFTAVGALLRRLDILVDSLKAQSHPEASTFYAFTHAISSLLQYARSELATLPSLDTSVNSERQLLIEISTKYAEVEEIMTAVAVLCRRDLQTSPRQYQPLPISTENLLSHVYLHIKSLTERAAGRRVRAAVAFILTTISQGYFKTISKSVGLGAVDITASSEEPLELPEEDEESSDESDEVQIERRGDSLPAASFPVFFSSELADTIPRARKSLELLKAAQNDHPLLHYYEPFSDLGWFWTEEEVISAWNRTQLSDSKPRTAEETSSQELALSAVSESKYKEEIKEFRIFDLPPGETLGQEASDARLPVSPDYSVQSFISAFPSELPSITPTLDHLSELVLTPLLERTRLLSGALLEILTSPSSYFNFHNHVYLLRSYLLLTSHSFRSRLEAACFSDSEDRYRDKQAARSLVVRPSRTSEAGKDENWAVGLAPELMERQSWPPGGTDLSFYLRTVIVDSLEANFDEADSEDEGGVVERAGRARIFQEADSRLGFAIRDLPTGTGREKWLNPLSIEALDFLYMEYRPPHPLDVLITPEVISKYQRMFAFLLRLMRVENGVRSLYRMTRRKSDPLFPTLASSNKLLLHFRFVAHSFVMVISTYVFDTAIRGNFDVLLSRLSSTATPGNESFSDVFTLADHHSSVMDDILSACLLRSGQKAAGDLLRGCLEYVLDLCNLAGMRRENRREEYEAAPMLEDLYNAFDSRMTTLVKVLRGVVEKEAAMSDIPLEYMDMLSGDRLAALRGTGSLRHLLHQLDKTHRSPHVH